MKDIYNKYFGVFALRLLLLIIVIMPEYKLLAANISSTYTTCGVGTKPILQKKVLQYACPYTSVDISAVVDVQANGLDLQWFSSDSPINTNQILDITRVGAGTYYAFYYDTNISCYSNVSSALSVFSQLCDTDSDGIPDNIDLDDDNDGILDSVEGCFIINSDLFIADGVEDVDVPIGAWEVLFYSGHLGVENAINADDRVSRDADNKAGKPVLVGEGYTNYKNPIYNFNITKVKHDDSFIDLLIPSLANWKSVSTYKPSGTYSIVFKRQMNANGRFTIGEIGGYFDDFAELFVNDKLVGSINEFYASLPEDKIITYDVKIGDKVELRLTNGADDGGFFLNIDTSFEAALDNDVIANCKDVDSDNDGIYDAQEAGHNMPIDNNGRIASMRSQVNALGIPLVVLNDNNKDNTLTEVNYVLRDTDGDGVFDFMDTDSDGDACYDVCEAYSSSSIDVNKDGAYGDDISTNPSLIAADGSVIAASYKNINPDYLTYSLNNVCQKDSDNDSVSDIIDVDDDNDGIYDIDEQERIKLKLNETSKEFSENIKISTGVLNYNVSIIDPNPMSNILNVDGDIDFRVDYWSNYVYSFKLDAPVNINLSTSNSKFTNVHWTIISDGNIIIDKSAEDDFKILEKSTRKIKLEKVKADGNWTISLKNTKEFKFIISTSKNIDPVYAYNGLFSTKIEVIDNIDTDKDGIFDHLDTDSDNDLCSDANEAYNNAKADSNNDGTYGGTVGAADVNADGSLKNASYAKPDRKFLNKDISICGDKPILDLDKDNDVSNESSYTAYYLLNGAEIAIVDTDAFVHDSKNTDLVSANILINNAKAGDKIYLNGSLPSGISRDATHFSDTEILLKGKASIDDYILALKLIRFKNTNAKTNIDDRSISLKVNNGASDSNIAESKVVINNVPDFINETSKLDDDSYHVDVNEGVGINTVIATILADDLDGDKLTYSIKGKDFDVFAINKSTGELSVTKLIDDYYVGDYTLNILVDDNRGGTDLARVSLSVINVNNKPLVFVNKYDVNNPDTYRFNTSFSKLGGKVSIMHAQGEIVDHDDSELESASIVLTNAQVGDDLLVSLDALSTLKANVDYSVKGKITITISGSAPLSDYTDAIAGIKFYNNILSPNTSDRIIDILVNDGELDSDISKTTINFNILQNNTSIVIDDLVDANQGQDVIINVLKNDLDIDTKSAVASVSTPSNGTVKINPDGTLTYKSKDTKWIGTDSFTYTNKENSTATVVVNVLKVDVETILVDDSAECINDKSIIIDVLDNDIDPDTKSAVDKLSVAKHGKVDVNANGTITYTPYSSSWTGTDSFTYTNTEGNTAKVDVNVIEPNIPTKVQDDTISTKEGVPIIIYVLDNDIDPDIKSAVQSVSVPTNGSVQINANGTLTYTPTNSQWSGIDHFSYTNTEGSLGNVTVTVLEVNDITLVADDKVSTPEGIAIKIDVLDNDIDPDTKSAVKSVSVPTNGSLKINADGTITYTPTNADWHGIDNFTYTNTEGNTAKVVVTVSAVNDPTTLVNDNVNAVVGNDIIIDVLANDIDVDTKSAVASVSKPTNGSVQINLDGTITYKPNDSTWIGSDSFTYTNTENNTARVVINISNVNIATTPVDDTVECIKGQSVIIDVLDNDIDPDIKSIVDKVSIANNAKVSLNLDGTITYKPYSSRWIGDDSFTYTNTEGNKATVHVRVVEANTPTILKDDTASTPEGQPVIIDVLDNDIDTDIKSIVKSVSVPINGSVKINVDGTLTYTPKDSDWNGIDTFTYTNTEGNTAKVVVRVTEVDDPTTLVNDTANTPEGQPVIIDVLDNDIDVDTKSAVATVSVPTNGNVQINADGTLTYIPIDSQWHGVDTFTYTNTEGNTATVEITVVEVNDPTIMVDDNASTPEGKPVEIDVLANDIDPDAKANVVSVSVATNGTVQINSNGKITYTPNDSDWYGRDTFTYTNSEGNTANVTVLVSSVNDKPVAIPDQINVVRAGIQTILVGGENSVANNDIDVEDVKPLGNVILVSDVKNGILTLNPDGSFMYKHNGGDFSNDLFTYKILDSEGLESNVAEVVINVDLEHFITKNDSSYEVLEDGSINIDMLTNDINIPSDGSIRFTAAMHGQLIINDSYTPDDISDDVINYVPNANYFGIDIFSYTVCDNKNRCSTSTVSLMVIAVNDAPIANDDNVEVIEDSVLDTFNVIDNDTDPENDMLIVSTDVVVNPKHGSLLLSDDGSFVYTPLVNYVGTDSFVYEVCDNATDKKCSQATVFINIIPNGNRAPQAYDLSVSAKEDTYENTLELTSPLDPEGDEMTVIITGVPEFVKFYLFDGTIVALGDELSIDDITNINFYSGRNISVQHLTFDVYDSKNNKTSAKISVEVTPVELIVPEVFTPNGDGVNDCFVITSAYKFPENTLRIFSRWGTKVYQRKAYDNSWNGFSNVKGLFSDDKLSVGTYYYIFDRGDGSLPEKGFVELIY